MHFLQLTSATLLALTGFGTSLPAPNSTLPLFESLLSDHSYLIPRSPVNKSLLTKDNSCGNVLAGKNHGWRCDEKRAGGGACCSPEGWCGSGPLYCGVGCQEHFGRCDRGNPKPVERRCGPAFNNQKCPGLDCCSPAGVCGIGKEYCMVPQNCQRGFGRCDSDMSPSGEIPHPDRHQRGEIPYGKFVNKCKVPRTIALTFDDGPNVHTEELLDMLKGAGAKATFFVGGNINGRQVDQGEKYPALVKRMIAEGHQVASHTWSHPHMNAISTQDREIEMLKNERAIANIIGKYPTYMRPPYGECDEKSGCMKDLKTMGYVLVGQTFDTLDWQHNIPKSQVDIEHFFDSLDAGAGAILCQHDFLRRSVQQLTPLILQKIAEKDLMAVTLGACLDQKEENWYRK